MKRSWIDGSVAASSVSARARDTERKKGSSNVLYSANMKAETTVTIEGKFHLLWESPDEVVSALKSFLGIGNVRASPPPADKSADAEVQEILADAAASMARSSDPMISAVPILPNKRL